MLIDYRNGVYAVDAGYVRPQLAAIHFVVDDGRVAIIDTASNACLPRVLAALDELGLPPAAVDYVMLTHIHLDHAGGAGAMMQAFPAARLVVHPRGARHMADPGKLMAATEEVYGRDVARALYGELLPVPAARIVESHDGLQVPLGGRQLSCFDAPGHAKHHIFIHEPQAAAIFTGDAFGLCYRELDVGGRHFVFPTTTPSQFDPAALHHTVERMLALQPEAMYLTHFSRISPPADLAADLLRRLDRVVAIACDEAGDADGRADRIASGIADYLLSEAQAHGTALADAEILALFQTDIDLNAQGLALWAASA